MIREKWYNYLLGGVFVLLIYIGLSFAIMPILNSLLTGGVLSYFIAVNLTFIPLFLGIVIVYKLYHKLGKFSIQYKKILIGFTLWMVFNIITLIITLIFHGESISFNFKPILFIHFFLLSLLFTPFQILSEELLFRGYLIGFLNSIKNNKLFIILGSSILFSLPHLTNPEVKDQKIVFFFIYLSMAFILGYLRVQYKGLEYSVGIHFANNFFAINLLNYPDSPLPSAPIFMLKTDVEPLPALIQTIIIGILTIIIIKNIEKVAPCNWTRKSTVA